MRPLSAPSPDGYEYRPFQLDGIHYMDCRKGCILADDMGLGKTVQICGVINKDASIKNVLIVAPVSARGNWMRELQTWLCRSGLTMSIWEGENKAHTDIVIVGYSILHRVAAELREREWDLLVCDEAHYLKNPSAKRTRAIRGGKGVPRMPARKKIMVTGTPMPNRTMELWPLLNIIDQKNWANQHRFGLRYCDAEYVTFGDVGQWEYKGASNTEELHGKLSNYMIRRKKKDVLTELPEKIRTVVEMESTEKVQRLAARERELIAQCKSIAAAREFDKRVGSLKPAMQEAVGEMSTIRKDLGLAKAEACAEYMNDTAEREGKVIVFAWHQEVIAMLSALARYDHAIISGKTKTKGGAREAQVDRFQNDPECRIFIGNVLAAGTAITLTAASEVLFAEFDWVPGNNFQAEDRPYRIGQQNTVFVQYLVVPDSIDAQIAKSFVHKQHTIDAVVDGHTPASDGDWVATLANLSNQEN